CGLAIGPATGVPALAPQTGRTPGAARAALEAAVRSALACSPCLVSFSGGRDSSMILALATHVARREGLPLPVPVTYRFTGDAGSDETSWQEQVVGHLGLLDWQRLHLTDELDVVGPVAAEQATRLGLLWPVNAHFFRPALALARGGALLTGIGGDELLGAGTDTAVRAVLGGRRALRPADLRRLAGALAPVPVRRTVLTHHSPLHQPWLTPSAARQVARERAGWNAHRPWQWDRARCRWWWPGRDRQSATVRQAALSVDTGARLVSPFLAPAVIAAVAGLFGSRGPASRTESVRLLAGDLLPAAVVTRRGKASFDGAFVTARARAYAATWDGSGLSPEVEELIDTAALRAAWASPAPDPRALLLLQATRFDPST
ncbi:MAG: asparagine synthase-related protein, partial [Pseudonocardiaceae bacterium]